jgi:hypothetical protein
MADPSGWATLAFLLTPDSILEDRTPLEAMRDGQVDQILRLVHEMPGDGFA